MSDSEICEHNVDRSVHVCHICDVDKVDPEDIDTWGVLWAPEDD